MATQIHNEITNYLSCNSKAKFLSLESALIEAILNDSNVRVIKNDEIKKIISINSSDKKAASEWIRQNIDKPNLQHVLTLYELRPSGKRKLDGAYYTPQLIVDEIVDQTVGSRVGTVCDPACGSGAFLLGVVKKLMLNNAGTVPTILSKYVWGVDIDKDNVVYSKRLLSLFAILNGYDKKIFNIGVYAGNSLIFSWADTPRTKAEFDFIVGNPPYVRGRNLSVTLKKQIKSWNSASVGIADLYMPFFEIGISWLKKGSGRLGYITPNTYFSSINGRGVRKMLTDRGIVEKIIDLDGFAAFEDLSTYTCVTILDKSGVKRPQVGVAKNAYELGKLSEIKLYPIDYSELQQNDWYIKPQSISRDMRQIETAGVSLQKYVARFTTGIATLRNDLYIFDTPVKDGYLVWKIDDKQFKIEVNATVPIIKPNKIKNHLQLAKNRERVLYPYRRSADGKRQELIPEDVMQKVFPGAYAYLKYIKHELDKRSSDAPASKWYAFGRSQALDGFGKKIILPMMSNSPSFLWVNDPKTLIYCGYALYPKSEHDVSILLKILNSDFFWYYISNTSKNYANGYKSFAKNYIKKFSIPRLDAKQKKLLLNLNSKETNQYLRKLYGLKS